MKFIVEFYSAYLDFAVLAKETSPGTKHLDEARELAGCDLPLDRIDDIICAIQIARPRIEICEEIARKSGRFKECGLVFVRTESLTNYLVPEYIIDNDPNTAEVKHVTIKRKLDEQAVIRAWEAAGFPLDWR